MVLVLFIPGQKKVIVATMMIDGGDTGVFHLREVCRKSKWKFKMAFAIRRPTPPPSWQMPS